MTGGERAETLRALEHEVGVMVRRVRRVIHERARAVHPDLQPAAYLMLSYLVEAGPVRSSEVSEVFGVGKGPISRQVQHLVDLGLVERSPDPADGRATLLSASADALTRTREVVRRRRRSLDEQLGDWSDEDLSGFVAALARYNRSLDGPRGRHTVRSL